MLAISSCQVKEEGEFAPEGKTFTATMESIADDAATIGTKTSMDSYGNVLWKKGDQVSIFVASTINQHFQVTDASDGKTAAALNPVESPGFVAGGDIPNNVAYYPYAATAAIAKRSGGAYLISDIALPATQNYAESSFGNGAFPMTAVTTSTSDYNLKFKNVLGGLKLQLKGTATIASISITGNNNEKFCGAAEVTVSGTTAPSINLTDATAKTVTLDCGDGVQLDAETATAFIIALPPMTMTGGFTVVATDTEGKQMEIKTTKSQTITRSNLLSMPAVTYEGTGSNPVSEPVAVDLGLPSGLKWASFNLGASAPEEYGDYFAWGETDPYYTSQDPLIWKEGKSAGYDWASYKFELGAGWQGPFSKYVTDSQYGTIDNKVVLYSEDDAASVNWGGSWRMPTYAEWDEIIAECMWIWTTQNGNNGYLVTSNANGNSIFLPAAGNRGATDLGGAGSIGFYWSSSLLTSHPDDAFGLYFESGNAYRYSGGIGGRCLGLSVRAVSDEGVRVSVTGVSLNENNLALVEGGTASLTATVAPSNATQPAVIWSSSNTAIATVDYRGNVTAVSAGNATITAITHDGGYTATCLVTVTAVPEAVDLGLTSGLKWASCNVGASTPEEYGDYFAWGDPEPNYTSQAPLTWRGNKTGYNWSSYSLCNRSASSLTKYSNSSSYGIVDDNTELDPEDDAATVNWGGTWRMPTLAEWQELLDECTWTWTTQNGINGRLVTGPNGNSLFLPAAGDRDDTNLFSAGYLGIYWSSSLRTDGPFDAYGVSFTSHYYEWNSYERYYGLSVRSVTE